MSKKHIVVSLTQKEAHALVVAAGNVMEYDDAIESIFGTTTNQAAKAADRAWAKLCNAYYGQKEQS